MKSSKTPDRERIARLRAAGLTVREIADAVGISFQRVAQILAHESLPDWTRATIERQGNQLVVSSDADVRIIHAMISQSVKRLGKHVENKRSE